jgi:hypothetical protein
MVCFWYVTVNTLPQPPQKYYYYFKFILAYLILGGSLLVSPDLPQEIKATDPNTLRMLCAVL